ncbi:MAG: DNA repair protein RadC [Chlamydiia bacterium]|nr:DNA repair protein RadC [Chlamydiia bacterium]
MTMLAQIPREERPRERLLKQGSDALSLTELLAICLGSGRRGVSVIRLAEELLSRFGTLSNLFNASVQALTEVKGIGPAKAIQLQATFALAKRMNLLAYRPKYPIQTSRDLYNYIAPKLKDQKQECVAIMLRDAQGNLFHDAILGIGTLTQVIIHPREVFHHALHHRAASLALAHNHPSGDPTPSTADIELTKLLATSGRLLGIPLDDHLIIGAHAFTSLFDAGYISSSTLS